MLHARAADRLVATVSSTRPRDVELVAKIQKYFLPTTSTSSTFCSAAPICWASQLTIDGLKSRGQMVCFLMRAWSTPAAL
jgi:hypothetical protein